MRAAEDKIRARLLRLESERREISQRIRTNKLNENDQRLLLFLVRIAPWLLMKLKKRTLLVGKLKEMLWGKKSESARDILNEINGEANASAESSTEGASDPITPVPDLKESNEEATTLSESSTEGASDPITPVRDLKENNEEATTLSGSSTEGAFNPITPVPETNAPALTTNEHDTNEQPPTPNNVVSITKKKRKYKKGRKSSVRGKAAYPNVEPIVVPHTELKSGDKCLKCKKGRIYPIKMGVFLKWIGQSCLTAILYLQQKFRCNACGWIFGAKMPQDVVNPNGSETAIAMIAVLKYGCGFPFFRLSKLQGWFKMPISPAALWKQLKNGLLDVVKIVWTQMRKVAAQGEVVHNDDTVGKVLSLMKKTPKDIRLPGEVKSKKKPRKAISTTGILSKVGNIRILLFFTGNANAGENLEELLKERDKCLKPPIQMSDAGSTNRPGKEAVEESLCITHGRRGFVRAYRSAKKACAYVILKLQEVYKIEAQAKREGLGSEERLKLHQEKSGPVMEELKAWFDLQIETKQVEPNSPLGEAIEYMRNHWVGLTAFLRIAGAPLTNDELEQAFKNVKIHLKNALFYKTLFGARVGDMMMSVIHTTILAGENPWEYLVEIQKNREAVKKDPGAWMPWNFRQAILATGTCQKVA